jgi:hypothetical protein
MCGCVFDVILDTAFLFFVQAGSYVVALLVNALRLVLFTLRGKS